MTFKTNRDRRSEPSSSAPVISNPLVGERSPEMEYREISTSESADPYGIPKLKPTLRCLRMTMEFRAIAPETKFMS